MRQTEGLYRRTRTAPQAQRPPINKQKDNATPPLNAKPSSAAQTDNYWQVESQGCTTMHSEEIPRLVGQLMQGKPKAIESQVQ